MILLLPNFIKNVNTLIFEIVIFPFLDGYVLALRPMEKYLSTHLVLLEHLAMLLTATLAINC